MSILSGAGVFIAEHVMPLVGRPMLFLARLNLRFELPWYVAHLRSKGITIAEPHFKEDAIHQDGSRPT